MSVTGAVTAAAAILEQVGDNLGTTVTVSRSPVPVHALPVNPDNTVTETWSPVLSGVPAIVVIGGSVALAPTEGGPRPGDWRVVLTQPGDTDVRPGDRVTIDTCRDPRYVGKSGLVRDLTGSSAGVGAMFDVRPAPDPTP